MARFGGGLAVGNDLLSAAEKAASQAVAPLQGVAPSIACVFACGDEAEQVGAAIDRAAAVTGAKAALGCSAPGVIGARRGVEALSSVSVWVGVLPQVRVRTFHLEVMPADAGMAVVGLPERDDADELCLLLADPWSFPVDGFVERSNDALTGLPVVGGLASGMGGRGSTRLLVDGRVVGRGAVGALLAGPVAATSVVSQGCRPVGPEMTVTAADGNVILQLAGVPAVKKLESIVAALDPVEQALVISGLQLGVAIDEYAEEHEQGDFLVRGVAGVDPARGGLVVGDLVPVGRTVRFQVRDAAAADADLRDMLRRFRRTGRFHPVEGALLFSCNGRGAHLFGTADHDVSVVSSELETSGVAGFFAAGEIGPVGGRNYVHGYTASVLAFGSPPGAFDVAEAGA